MTSEASQPSCILCNELATEVTEPPRRTWVRGLDPSDTSYSVTVLLPDVALCAEHALEVRQGDRLVGWCDDQLCRTYGELGKPSDCGDPFKNLVPGRR